MSNSNKNATVLEKFKQALSSTAKVISDDISHNDKINNNKSSNKFDFFFIWVYSCIEPYAGGVFLIV